MLIKRSKKLIERLKKSIKRLKIWIERSKKSKSIKKSMDFDHFQLISTIFDEIQKKFNQNLTFRYNSQI